MKRNSKKVLYESIMTSVAKQVKRTLNEYDNWTTTSTANITNIDKSLFVNMGFETKTWWCKYNLGVNPNKLDRWKDWDGNFYAWGELKPKQNYSWDTYKFGDKREIIKYNYDDNLRWLDPKDDIVQQIYHTENIFMPSIDNISELWHYTTQKHVLNYNGIENLHGIIFTSKINGNEIFIPCAGYYCDGQWYGSGHYLSLWSSSVNTDAPQLAYSLYSDCHDITSVNSTCRCYGLSIRPVYHKFMK